MAVLVVGAITACTLVESESSLTLAQARKSLQKRNVTAADEADWSRFARRAVESRQGFPFREPTQKTLAASL